MFPQMISDYYRWALEKAREEVRNTADDQVIGMDRDEWLHYIVKKYGMEPIKADLNAIQMEETTAKGYPAVRVFAPVEMTDTLKVA